MAGKNEISGIHRFARFLVVGALGFLINACCYLLLKQLYTDDFFLRVIAPFFSFEISIFSNYLIYHHWVWRDRRKETTREFWLGFFHYNIATAFGFLITVLVMNLMIEFIPWFRMGHPGHVFSQLSGFRITERLSFALHAQGRYIFANFCGAAAAALFNFIATNTLVFRHKKKS